MEEKKFRNFKNQKFAGLAWIMVVLVIVIAVFLNMIVSRLDFSVDISPNKQYSLSDTTTSYLQSISDEGEQIDFYILAKMDELEDDLQTLSLYRALLEYDSYDCINLIDVDPQKDDAILEKLNSDNALTLSTGDMILVKGDVKKRIPGSTMYLQSADDSGNVSESFNGENIITGCIKSLVDGFVPTVYFLTGHGEKTIADNYTQLQKNLKNFNYAAKQLNLADVEEVPADAALIIAAAPTTDITTAEKEKLDAYLDKGGNLSLLMSPNAGTFNYTNFDRIMEDFSIIMEYDEVHETDAANHIAGDDTTIQCELVEMNDESEAADLTSALLNEGLIPFMPTSRSFYFINNENFGYMITASLLQSYTSAVGVPNGGEYESDDVTDTTLMLAGYAQNNNRNSAKLVVFGSADFIDDTHVQSSNYLVSVYLYLSTISWMYNTDVDMGIASKSFTYDYLVLSDTSTGTSMIAIFSIVPITIILIGLIVWIKRRNS